MVEIRVAIAGLGGCGSAIVQGIYYYQDAREDEFVPGLMHVKFGDYHIRDVKFVTAFDVNKEKIGKDLSEAIFAEPCYMTKITDVPYLGVKVLPAPILDGVAPHMVEEFRCYNPEEMEPVNVAEELKKAKADVLVNLIPVGSAEATRMYAKACLEAGCAFINCIPEFIASDESWAKRFEESGLPVAGDDIKSQLGATILHRTIANLMQARGIIIEETYQLNIGGDSDFLNMTVEERLFSKRISKTEAVTSLIGREIPTRIGPSDYVPFLGDQKICYIYARGRKFGDRPIRIDLKLSVEDSPNSAGVQIDAIRATKIALDRGISGQLISISSYSFKHPPVQVPDHVARQWVEEFIEGKRER